MVSQAEENAEEARHLRAELADIRCQLDTALFRADEADSRAAQLGEEAAADRATATSALARAEVPLSRPPLVPQG